MKLSIIVPVYNVEKYIESFFYSLVFQINEDIELIFINDGSTDSSLQKLEHAIKLFPNLKDNIQVINQDNKGQSEARNHGLKKSRGEYIAFLDSDDLVEENYIKKIIENLQNKPDVLSFEAIAFSDITNKFLWSVNSTLKAGIYISDVSFLAKVFRECSWQPWLRIVKRELIVQKLFPKDKLLEDIYVFSDIYLAANKIQHINLSLVRYRQRENSSVRIVDDRLISGYADSIFFLKTKEKDYPFVSLSIEKLQLSYYSHLIEKRSSGTIFKIFLKDNISFKNRMKILKIFLRKKLR